MPTVLVKAEPGREWVMEVRRVPVTAFNARGCDHRFLEFRGGIVPVEVGTVLVEALRNDKGVQVAVVLPNGYCLPTGRVAPRAAWFAMLKAHLRSWLAMTPAGRIVRIVTGGIQAFEAQRAAGHLADDKCRAAVAKLEQFRAEALGELPPGVSEQDLLAGFYNWVTEAASQANLDQAQVVAIVDRALRSGKRVQVPDLADGIMPTDFQRFLDL